MRKTLSLLGCVFALCLFADAALGHGGTYTGPGGGGTPGYGGPTGGGTGQPGGNPGNGPPGGSTPPPGSPGGTSGNPGGGAPPVRPGGGARPSGGRGFGGTTPGGKKSKYTPKHLNWDWWWDLNEERFLNLKSKVRQQAAASENKDKFLGGVDDGDDIALVSQKLTRNSILPALKLALKDSYYDARAGAVIALGKVGKGEELIDNIKGLLSDKDKVVRESACLALGILGSKGAVTDLFEVVRNTRKGKKLVGVGTRDILNRTRAFATVAIGLIGTRGQLDSEITGELLKLAQTPSKQKDLQVGPALALQLIPGNDAVPQMLEIFKDSQQDRFVRAHIGVALGKVGAKSAVGTLVKGLSDKVNFVQYSSAISLGLLTEKEDRDTINKLIRKAKSASDRGTRNFCIMALGEIGNAKGRAFLMELAKKGKLHDQSFACLALGVMGFKFDDEKTEMGRLILDLYRKTKSESQRGPMAIALGLLEYVPAQDVMRQGLVRPGSQNLKGNLATALGLMNDKHAIPSIQELVKQKGDPDLRKRAAIALGLLQDTEGVEILRKVISESTASKAILGAATVALGYIGDRSAVEILVDFVENPKKTHQDVTRAFATVALGFLGDKDDIPLLSKIHEHSNYLAQTAALAELLSIL
ncbi:MAG: hypothetical protein CMJ83_08205 [Planctomycetes bacterium]|nr:hypothetical protein [Planctomycetota bacterium]